MKTPKDPKDTTDAIGIFAICQLLLAAGALFTGPLDSAHLFGGFLAFGLWYGLRLWHECATDTARPEESEPRR